jgi:hypothetical protein
MREIERARRYDGRHQIRLTQIEGEIPQDEQLRVLRHSLEAEFCIGPA